MNYHTTHIKNGYLYDQKKESKWMIIPSTFWCDLCKINLLYFHTLINLMTQAQYSTLHRRRQSRRFLSFLACHVFTLSSSNRSHQISAFSIFLNYRLLLFFYSFKIFNHYSLWIFNQHQHVTPIFIVFRVQSQTS